jgi:hypothetical protein
MLVFSVTVVLGQQPENASEQTQNSGAKDESSTESGSPEQSQISGTEKTVQMTDIHDIKPPEKIGVNFTLLYYVLGTILMLALLAILFIWFRKRKKKIKEKEIVVLPPDEAAFASLDELTEVERIDGKTFYFRLSAILRTYIYERYGINAPEMTTEEFLPHIEKLELPGELKKGVRALCHSADPVKFAGLSAVQTVMENDLNFVRNFVKQTTVSV